MDEGYLWTASFLYSVVHDSTSRRRFVLNTPRPYFGFKSSRIHDSTNELILLQKVRVSTKNRSCRILLEVKLKYFHPIQRTHRFSPTFWLTYENSDFYWFLISVCTCKVVFSLFVFRFAYYTTSYFFRVYYRIRLKCCLTL